jgi:hypothetical protein
MKPIKFSSEGKMRIVDRFKVFSFFLLAAYLLAACGGTLPGTPISAKDAKGDANLVAFTGVVEAIDDAAWTVSGQKLILNSQAALDPTIAVGDEVKVEANVLSDGAVVALKIEPSPEVSSTPDPAVPQTGSLSPSEVWGAVEALTADTITVNGVTYDLASFTEFKGVVGIGDQVKLHVIFKTDGTFTVREIEKFLGFPADNSNSSGSNEDPAHHANEHHSNGNLNDDSHHHSDDHGNDDHGGSGHHGSDD